MSLEHLILPKAKKIAQKPKQNTVAVYAKGTKEPTERISQGLKLKQFEQQNKVVLC